MGGNRENMKGDGKAAGLQKKKQHPGVTASPPSGRAGDLQNKKKGKKKKSF